VPISKVDDGTVTRSDRGVLESCASICHVVPPTKKKELKVRMVSSGEVAAVGLLGVDADAAEKCVGL